MGGSVKLCLCFSRFVAIVLLERPRAPRPCSRLFGFGILFGQFNSTFSTVCSSGRMLRLTMRLATAVRCVPTRLFSGEGKHRRMAQEILQAISSDTLKYKDICELQCNSTHVAITLADASTGVCSLWLRSLQQDDDFQKISPDDLSIRTNHNGYGASSMTMDDHYLVALSKNVFYLFDLTQLDLPPRELPICKDGVTYGDPILANDNLVVVMDDSGEQQIVVFLLYEVLHSNDEAKPVVVIKSDGYFYGGLTFGPVPDFIAYMRWTGGMAFDNAEIEVYDIIEQRLGPMAHYKKDNAALLHPQFTCFENIWYIQEETAFPQIIHADLLTLEKEVVNIHQGIEEDIGDVVWIVGNQRCTAVAGDFYAYATKSKIYVHNHKDLSIKPVIFDAAYAVLLTAVPNSSKFLFKEFGPRSYLLRCIDMSASPPSICTIYELSLLDSAIETITPMHSNIAKIPGYFAQPKQNVDAPSRTIIWLHGGPTMLVKNSLDLRKQFYLASGFNIYDLEYTGSHGFGRNYRQALYGSWGEKDAEDVFIAAKSLIDAGIADPKQLFLVGSSAGAYLALNVLARDKSNVFCGASISASFYDGTVLVKDAIPFERAYTKRLVMKTPLEHMDDLLVENRAAIYFFHGEKDEIIDSKEAYELHMKMKDAGCTTKFAMLKGDGHSIKKANNVTFMLQESVSFFDELVKSKSE